MNAGEPCWSCGFAPRHGFECIAEEWERLHGKTTHPGKCWNGHCPANAFDTQELEESRDKQARRDFERRKREQHQQLSIEAA